MRSGGSSRPATSARGGCSSANRDKLESLTQALLEHETLDEDDAYRAAGFDATRCRPHGADGDRRPTGDEPAEAARADRDVAAERQPATLARAPHPAVAASRIGWS